MKRLLLSLILFFPALASAQELHTFSNGEVADAEKINENFQYVLENATGSGGCSAEQDGSSVVITCADGTSGVLASEGTVVVYPEGGIVGESPVQSWPTGTIVFEDNNGVLLAEASELSNLLVFDLDDVKGTFVNLPQGRVVVTSWRSGERIYFSSEDCSGQQFGTTDIMIYDWDGELAVPLPNTDKQDILSNSYLKSGSGNFKTDSYTASGSCNSEQSVVSAYPLVEYTPPKEFLNAAYPVRLAQLP
jgi:hypothetical protein